MNSQLLLQLDSRLSAQIGDEDTPSAVDCHLSDQLLHLSSRANVLEIGSKNGEAISLECYLKQADTDWLSVKIPNEDELNPGKRNRRKSMVVSSDRLSAQLDWYIKQQVTYEKYVMNPNADEF